MPHSISVLASQPSSSLPVRPISPPTPPPPQHALPEIQPSLYTAYHYALTHPPPKELGPTNPARYKVAVALIEESQKNPRWEPVPSLYGISSSNATRVSSIAPWYPVALDEKANGKGKEAEEPKFPPHQPRPIMHQERVAPLVSQQGSRIPALAQKVLPVSTAPPSARFNVSQVGNLLTDQRTPAHDAPGPAAAAGAGRPEADVRPRLERTVEFGTAAAAAAGAGERRCEGRREEGEGRHASGEACARREAVCNVELGAEDVPRRNAPPARREREPGGDDGKWEAEEREPCRAVEHRRCRCSDLFSPRDRFHALLDCFRKLPSVPGNMYNPAVIIRCALFPSSLAET